MQMSVQGCGTAMSNSKKISGGRNGFALPRITGGNDRRQCRKIERRSLHDLLLKSFRATRTVSHCSDTPSPATCCFTNVEMNEKKPYIADFAGQNYVEPIDLQLINHRTGMSKFASGCHYGNLANRDCLVWLEILFQCRVGNVF